MNHLSLPVVQNVVVLFLGVVNDCLELDNDHIDPLDLDISQTSKHLHGVDHVRDPLQALAESVKLPEDIVLTESG